MRHLVRVLGWTLYLFALVAVFSTGCSYLDCLRNPASCQPGPLPTPTPTPTVDPCAGKAPLCVAQSDVDCWAVGVTGECVFFPAPPSPQCPAVPATPPVCPPRQQPDYPAWKCGAETGWVWVGMCKPIPPPPPSQCDEASIPLDRVKVDSKPYGKGYDSTVKVQDAAWCAAHGMAEWGNVCPLAPEGDKCRNVRERFVLAPHVCPRFLFLSCNQSNPQACPGTFKSRIGDNPHQINASAGCPDTVHENEEIVEAFWAQPSGDGVIAACTWKDDPNGKPLGCGKQWKVNQ